MSQDLDIVSGQSKALLDSQTESGGRFHFAEPHLPFRTAEILDRVLDAFVVLDRDWRIVYANKQACALNKKELSEFLGKTQWEEWPGTLGTELERQYRLAMETQVDVHFEHRTVAARLDYWLEIHAYPTPDSLSIFCRDITSSKRATQEIDKSREDLRVAVNAARLGTFYCDWPLDKIIWNDTCKEHFFLPNDAEVDFALFYSRLHSDDVEPTRRAIDKAMSDRVAYDVEYRTVSPDGKMRWINAVGRFYYGSDGRPIRFDGVTLDISGRKAAEHAVEHANSRIIGILESITDAFFGLDQNLCFTYVNSEAEKMFKWTRKDVIGQYVFDVFPLGSGSVFEKQYRQALAEGNSIYFEEWSKTLEIWLEVRIFPSSDGLSIFMKDVDARKRDEAEREQLISEQRARAEREELLNLIGQSLRSLDPEAVGIAVVNLLGEALSADRCYLAIYDLHRGTVHISCDWHREGLKSVEGIYPFPNTVEMFQELYKESHISIVVDRVTAEISDETKENMVGLDLRSRASVALVDSEGSMATLTAAMSDGPREWTVDEVSLIEAVALQLRSSIAAARIAQREHNLAMQLQEALQPELPASVVGMAVTRHYRPALAQSEGVGGDFYDVFTMDDARTALIVGDLSGKGLAAAAQVSTVRNILRGFMYSMPTVGAAVHELNRVLSENSLITGFATLFVGIYNSASRVLNYVNCGQEPALVRRAANLEIHQLGSTGSVVGAIVVSRYTEEQVTLAAGDALAIFTDGLTEVGASRKVLLEVEGVSALFAQPVAAGEISAGQLAETLAANLIAGVDAFAQSGIRDDMCLLIGVVR